MYENNRLVASLFFSILINSFILFLFFRGIFISSFNKSFNINASKNIIIDLDGKMSGSAVNKKNICRTIQNLEAEKTEKSNIQNVTIISNISNLDTGTDNKIISEGIDNLAVDEGGGIAGGLTNLYLDKVYQKIEQNKYYPKIAKMRKNEGIVNIGFTIQKDGKICDIKILKKSSYKILNNAAIETVLKCSPFEVILNNFGEEKINMDVNVSYKLK